MQQKPKLLADAMEQNQFDVDIVTKKLKLPWLKLDIKAPKMSAEYLETLHADASDLRTAWQFRKLKESAYQVKEWDSQILFGPKPFDEFLTKVSSHNEFDFSKFDSDSKARFFRDKHSYDWYVPEDEPLRQWISSFLPDEDISLVYSYWAPPGGYVFPHRDYAHDGMGLNKLYCAIEWPEGNTFGMYGVGNMPVAEGDVFFIGNYILPHWVYNASNKTRLVIAIGADPHSPSLKKLIQHAFEKMFDINLRIKHN